MKSTNHYRCIGLRGESIIRMNMAHARDDQYYPHQILVEGPNFDQKFRKLAGIFICEHSSPLCQNALHDMQYDTIGNRPAKDVMMDFGETLFNHFVDKYPPYEILIHENEMNAMLLFAQGVYKQGLESDDKNIKEKVLEATCFLSVDDKFCASVLREQIMGNMAEELTARTGGVHPNHRPDLNL